MDMDWGFFLFLSLVALLLAMVVGCGVMDMDWGFFFLFLSLVACLTSSGHDGRLR